MSLKCYSCGKKSVTGMTVSHSMRHSKRLFKPNLQMVSILVKGKKKKEYVCTKCLKANKVLKASRAS